MSIWSTLGIDPTRDKREIKRAYAKMAARYHPEEQPEKFQEIYDAYEQALSYAEGYAGTEYHFEEVVYKEEPVKDSEVSLGNHASVPKSEMIDFYKLTADSPDKPMPPNEENSINFDGKIPQTPRQRIVLKDGSEENQIDFEGRIPKTPRQGLNRIEDDEEVRIDFERLAPDSDRKLMLKPPTEQTINFQSIVREESPDEPQYHAEPEVHVKKKKKMCLEAVLKIIVIIGTWCFMWGLLHEFKGGDTDVFSGFKEPQSGQERVQRTLERSYDTGFFVTPMEIPDSMNGVYYLVADGKKIEDYQWFECGTTDGAVQVTFIASLDDSGAINYDYSYKQLFAFLYHVGLGGYLDYADIQKNNLGYMNKGEKRYCYPIIKLASANVNDDFFQRINQLCDLVQNSEAQFYNREQLTINIKNSSNGAVYNLHISKGKKVDIKVVKQELLAFFGR